MSKTSMTRRSFVAVGATAAAATALSLSGCGSKPAANNAANNAAAPAANNAAAPAAGGTITAALSHPSAGGTFSPIGASSAVALPADQHVLEGLYMIDYVDYSTYAALAAGEPKKVADLEYEVELREGAKFSDGSAVTADDVVASFEANMAEGKLYVPFLEFISAVSAKDDKTVSFKLNYETSVMKERFACVLVFKKGETHDSMKGGTLGSGPWMFEGTPTTDEGSKFFFVPNPNYNGPKPAKAEKMEWNVLGDATSRTTAMTEGSIMVMEDVPDANADAVKGSGAKLEYLDGFCLPFIMFNCIKAPFDNPKARQAVFYAIDVEKLIANQLNGHAKAPSCFLPESHKNYHKAATVFTYDPEKAKALLKEAGVEEGTAITFRSNSNWVKDLAPQIQNDLKAVGLEVELDVNSTFYGDMKDAATSPYTWDVALAPGDPSCFGADPDLLMSWWYDNDAWLNERSCWALATDGKCAELRELMKQAREAAGDKQQQLWNDCFDMIADQVPLYPLLHKQMPTAWHEDKIAGFKPISATGLFFMEASVK